MNILPFLRECLKIKKTVRTGWVRLGKKKSERLNIFLFCTFRSERARKCLGAYVFHGAYGVEVRANKNRVCIFVANKKCTSHLFPSNLFLSVLFQ